jgi:hypothetical protein
MSLSNKLRSIQQIASELKRWPDDSHKAYMSFRNNQIERFEESAKGSSNKVTIDLEIQPSALQKLGQDVNKNKVSNGTRRKY